MKRILSLLLCLCLLLGCCGLPAFAEGAVLRLPAGLKTVEEEAFAGDSSLGEVVLPEGLESIGARAFADSSVMKINLPDSLRSIGEGALPVGQVEVSANPDTYAYDWAAAQGYIPTDVPVDEGTFPDAIFRAYVAENFDSNRDGFLNEAEVHAATTVDLSGLGVSDLTGLRYLYELTELKLSGCTALNTLEFSSQGYQTGASWAVRRLRSLDISGCTSLRSVTHDGYNVSNQLTELDCRGCTSLTHLDVSNCHLNTLNLSGCTAMATLFCSTNDLTELDVSTCTSLRILSCGSNELTELDVSHNPDLESLYCYNSPLTELDVSHNPRLETCTAPTR